MSAPSPTRVLAAEGAPRGGLAALCITQTTGWGVLYYALITAVRPISEDTGWDPALVTGAFSAVLLVSAVAGIFVGRALDRSGPRTLMIGGSLVGVLALAGVALAPNLPAFFAAWMLAGTAQAAVLYQPAFTVISRWYGPARIRPLTLLTLVAGFASTISAPTRPWRTRWPQPPGSRQSSPRLPHGTPGMFTLMFHEEWLAGPTAIRQSGHENGAEPDTPLGGRPL